jgi:hypothetical protein
MFLYFYVLAYVFSFMEDLKTIWLNGFNRDIRDVC